MEGKGVAESHLLYTLGRDYGDHVFKFLASRDAGRLERAFTRELVFVPAGGGAALLRSVAGRRQVEAAKAGATLVPLGERRGGRIAWATELRWLYMAMGRLWVGKAKKMIKTMYSYRGSFTRLGCCNPNLTRHFAPGWQDVPEPIPNREPRAKSERAKDRHRPAPHCSLFVFASREVHGRHSGVGR